MEKLLLLPALFILTFSGALPAQSDGSMPSKTFTQSQQKAEALLATLSLDDKVGEMTQFALDVLCEGQPYNVTDPLTLDKKKMQKVLVELRVGSILNVAGHAYTREQWEHIITAIQAFARQKPSGIPVLYGIDAIHGTNYTAGSTLFPQEISLAATWNPALAQKMGEVTAYETMASGIPWSFSPVLDIGRDPRWPRFWETLGEDTYLASRMAEAIIRGYQGSALSNRNTVAACMKHFLGYSFPLTGKDRTQAWIPERQLKEYFTPTFQAAIDAGALTVMINSGEMNGIPVHCNPAILKDLLRDEMGFKGFVVTDWEDIGYLYTRHHVAKDYKEAIKLAINAGIDMAMVPMDLRFPVLLKELVEEGEVPMSRIDEAVTRILTVKYELGLFDHPYFPFDSYPDFGSAEHADAAYRAAQEALVLLKNDGVLPLSKSSKVLVTGPTANSILDLNGGWSRVWQGNAPQWHETGKKTILGAVRDKLGEDRVTYVEGAAFDEVKDLEKAADAAKDMDAAIVCIGEMPYCETPGNINDLALPQAQLDLVTAIAGTGTPVILVLVEGRPRILRTIEPLAKGVLGAFLPGNEGGRAIADVLFGDYNPNGKLPFTYPRYAHSLMTYDYKGTDLNSGSDQPGFNPQWPFGHGLSYTTFNYSDLKLSATKLQLSTSESLTVEVTVTNTGQREGKEVVQLYVSDKVASITPPVKRLRAFDKVSLQPGESKTVTFTIAPRDLAFVGIGNKWVTEPGDFEVSVGGLKAGFTYLE
ncbi:MAG: glycoside hydrolase family 3 N-terminal domain-containing protein [Saprospiraceae bacterium]